MLKFYFINFVPVMAAAVGQWILGALWYSLLFNKPWMALTGHTKAEKPKGMVLSMVTSFIGGLILAFVLAHVIIWSGVTTCCWGAFIGFICWLGFVAAPLFSEKMYEQRPMQLFAINSGYWLVCLVGSGVLLAVWQ